jgi:hypothetical protein
MVKNGYRWILAATVAAGMSGAALADGDGGDSSMSPFNGDSWAALEGHGHNLGRPDVAPSGAFAAHEMDGQRNAVPLGERMRQAEAKAAAFADRMRQQTLAAMHASPSYSSPSNSDGGTTRTDNGVRIAPVNPKGQAPTIIGPTSSVAPAAMPANTFEDTIGG